MIPSEQHLSQFVETTHATGGATMSQKGKMLPVHWEHNPQATTHYAVGGARMESGKGERWPTSVISVNQFSPDLMKSHIEGMQSRGLAPGAHVGSWKEGGFVELDVSSVERGGPAAEARAMALTKARNEKAYFKTNPGQEVRNPDYRETPSTATVTPMRGILNIKQHMLER